MGANLEQISSMFRVTYSKDASDGRTSDNFSIDDTASNWLWWWFRYFKENTDYKAYCTARRIGDRTAYALLEGQFERISELYSDWGDIHDLTSMHKNEMNWRVWLYERRHLFFVDVPPVKLLTLPITEMDTGSIALQIPNVVTKDEVLLLLTEFIDKRYSESEFVEEPKYQLYAPEGRIDQSTFQSIKKAFYVHTASEHHTKYPTSHAGTALEIMALELKEQLGFAWELDDDQIDRLENGTLSMMELESVKRQVGRYKANYAAYVANTIHGIFPKK